jgi:hypothetical protein
VALQAGFSIPLARITGKENTQDGRILFGSVIKTESIGLKDANEKLGAQYDDESNEVARNVSDGIDKV